ncbi:MAG: ADP-ribosylglycohydrolase family protein [Lachnospiraceae bacterium]|nr:ADP-ribosylglycohydrolase family protein [Lachnospiraceae bacterium]
MYGAILGDMIGSPYEFHGNKKTTDFPLFINSSRFTDDSVMTVAVAEALMDSHGKDDPEIKKALVASMQKWGRKYPRAGYGGSFYRWLKAKHPQPYHSFGNGSAMRVSAAGWLFDSLEETRHMARLSAEVTHDHLEGIKGAEAVASAIFLARTGNDKDTIKEYIVQEFGYDLSRTIDEIRPGYSFDVSCQGSVPEAIIAFLESESFEEAARKAVSLGGDSDTQAAIAGSIAEAMYGVPEEMAEECRKRLPEDMLAVVDRFHAFFAEEDAAFDPFLEGNEIIREAVSAYYKAPSEETVFKVTEAVRTRMHADGHFLVPVTVSEDGTEFAFRTLLNKNGEECLAAFTSREEYEKGTKSQVLSDFIDQMLKVCLDTGFPGIIIDPWGESFMLTKDLIEMMIKADGGTQYHVPDGPVTQELLADGSFLKNAAEICSRNRSLTNMMKLMKILRDSWVWIPCTAVFSDADQEAAEKMVAEAAENGGPESLAGQMFTTKDDVRLVPDVLQNGEDFFFPVFTSAEEMGDYGNNFSKIEKHFLKAMDLAQNNEKNVAGIVINAFSEPLVIPKEWFGMIAELPSAFEKGK